MEASLTKESALSFLHDHQPMPDDSDLRDELIQQYDKVRKYCRDNPAPEFIPLLLNSFGHGSGFGVYQVVEDALRPYSPGEVVPHLKRSLTSRHGGVRHWSADIAAGFPSLELLPELTDLLKDQDSDIRSSAVLALSQLDPQIISPLFLKHLHTEPDSDIIDLINDQLSDLS